MDVAWIPLQGDCHPKSGRVMAVGQEPGRIGEGPDLERILVIGSFPGYEPTPRAGALPLTSPPHPQQLLSPHNVCVKFKNGGGCIPHLQNSPFQWVSRQGQKCSVGFLGHRRMGRPVYKEDLSSLHSQGNRGGGQCWGYYQGCRQLVLSLPPFQT